MTGLEALEKVKRTIKAELAKLDLMGFEKSDKYNYLEQLLDDLTEVEKSLKALEIIKEKRIDIESFYTSFIDGDYDYDFYERRYGTYGKYCLTEEEFNTLKEVLE